MTRIEDDIHGGAFNFNSSVGITPNTNGDRAIFCKNLRFYMKRQGKTQKEVAQTIGVTAATFSEWCNGKKYPRIEKLGALAKYFGISVPELVGEQVTPPETNNPKVIGKDEVLDIILRLHTDAQFLEAVEKMSMLDNDKLNALQKFLDAFSK